MGSASLFAPLLNAALGAALAEARAKGPSALRALSVHLQGQADAVYQEYETMPAAIECTCETCKRDFIVSLSPEQERGFPGRPGICECFEARHPESGASGLRAPQFNYHRFGVHK